MQICLCDDSKHCYTPGPIVFGLLGCRMNNKLVDLLLRNLLLANAAPCYEKDQLASLPTYAEAISSWTPGNISSWTLTPENKIYLKTFIRASP